MHRSIVHGPDIVPLDSAAGASLDRTNADGSTAGYTLVTGHTYLYELGPAAWDAPFQSFHIKWDATAVLTITVEDSNFPDVASWSMTAGDWEKEDVPTAYIAHDGGATVTSGTVSVPGGTAGGCLIHLCESGAIRTRLKVVATTGGVVRVAGAAKE
jgi:hypothetical protein